MSDELEEAASRAVCLSQTCKPEESESEENTLLYQLGRAILAGPRWHDKPPAPGLYVMPSKLSFRDSLTWPVTSDLIANWPHGRVYGPIPPDPG